VTVGIYGSPSPLQEKAARIALKKHRQHEKDLALIESLAKETNDKGFHKTSRALARFAEKGRKRLRKKRGLESERCNHVDSEKNFPLTPFSSLGQRLLRESSAEKGASD